MSWVIPTRAHRVGSKLRIIYWFAVSSFMFHKSQQDSGHPKSHRVRGLAQDFQSSMPSSSTPTAGNVLLASSRRRVLESTALGFGYLALRSLMGEPRAMGQEPTGPSTGGPLVSTGPHLRPRAKRIVFLFMKGGPSHIDTFDPKPSLTRDDGKPPPFELPRVVFAQQGNCLLYTPPSPRDSG